MIDHRQRWALVLGASSGFGEACSLALAAAGYDIAGVHLDRRGGMQHVEEVRRKIAAHGREAIFFNGNAADDEQRANGREGETVCRRINRTLYTHLDGKDHPLNVFQERDSKRQDSR